MITISNRRTVLHTKCSIYSAIKHSQFYSDFIFKILTYFFFRGSTSNIRLFQQFNFPSQHERKCKRITPNTDFLRSMYIDTYFTISVLIKNLLL